MTTQINHDDLLCAGCAVPLRELQAELVRAAHPAQAIMPAKVVCGQACLNQVMLTQEAAK